MMYKLLSYNELHTNRIISCAWGSGELVPKSANPLALGVWGKQAQPQCSWGIQGVFVACLEGHKTMIILCPTYGGNMSYIIHT